MRCLLNFYTMKIIYPVNATISLLYGNKMLYHVKYQVFVVLDENFHLEKSTPFESMFLLGKQEYTYVHNQT